MNKSHKYYLTQNIRCCKWVYFLTSKFLVYFMKMVKNSEFMHLEARFTSPPLINIIAFFVAKDNYGKKW